MSDRFDYRTSDNRIDKFWIPVIGSIEVYELDKELGLPRALGLVNALALGVGQSVAYGSAAIIAYNVVRELLDR